MPRYRKDHPAARGKEARKLKCEGSAGFLLSDIEARLEEEALHLLDDQGSAG